MDVILASLFEKSVVYGAFVLLLYHVLHKQDRMLIDLTNKQDKQLVDFGKTLKESNKTMKEISETLIGLENRLEKIERSQGGE